jgi:hypothetical protein
MSQIVRMAMGGSGGAEQLMYLLASVGRSLKLWERTAFSPKPPSDIRGDS